MQLHVFFDLFHGQRARGLVTFQGDGARSDKWVPALLLKDCGVCDAAERPKLEINVRFVFVHRIGDLRLEKRGDTREGGIDLVIREGKTKRKASANLFPCRDLLITPDAGDVIISASAGSDERSFGNG
jgi:hypothetical protein